MGPVITVNSATLVNKGLEVIEAHLLFGVPYDRIDVVVHPQSLVHSMVEFVDGSTLAQASPPDMRLPIALGLAWPERLPRPSYGLDWTRASTWEFEPLDETAFPAVALCKAAGRRGGTAPAVLNAANEVCVEAFVAGRCLPRHRRHGGRGRRRTSLQGTRNPCRGVGVRGVGASACRGAGRSGSAEQTDHMTDITTDTTGERMTDLADRPATGSRRRCRRPVGRWSGSRRAVAVMAWFALTGHAGYVLGFVGFVVALLVSVCLHEGGHYLTASPLRHEGHPVLRRLRADAVVPVSAERPSGASRASRSRLRQDRRDDAAGEGRRRRRAPGLLPGARAAEGRRAGRRSTVHFLLTVLLIVGGTFAIGAIREGAPAVGAVSTCIAPDRIGVTDIAADTDPCTLPGSLPAPAVDAGLRARDVVTAVDGAPWATAQT
jgi:hypothetical protein